jgi:hypothetical protein
MAKKKVVSSPASSSTSGSKRKSQAKAASRQSSDAKKPASKKPKAKKQGAAVAFPCRQRVLSDHQIGEVAGEIWHLLAEHGGQGLAALKNSIDAPAELVLAAVGWLAREGKLNFATSGRSLNVSLRK